MDALVGHILHLLRREFITSAVFATTRKKVARDGTVAAVM